MKCPYCGKETRVVDSRDSCGIRERRRECKVCSRRFTTYEAIVADCATCRYTAYDKNVKYCNNPDSRKYGDPIRPTMGCRRGRE